MDDHRTYQESITEKAVKLSPPPVSVELDHLTVSLEQCASLLETLDCRLKSVMMSDEPETAFDQSDVPTLCDLARSIRLSADRSERLCDHISAILTRLEI